MKPITEEQRFEFYAWHLCEQTDAYIEDYRNATTVPDRQRAATEFRKFLAHIRTPEFVGVFRQRFMLNTGLLP